MRSSNIYTCTTLCDKYIYMQIYILYAMKTRNDKNEDFTCASAISHVNLGPNVILFFIFVDFFDILSK